MPCYDPPPPWEGERRVSAEQAARLLCAIVAERLEQCEPVSRELLAWWRDHRKIDAQIMAGGSYKQPHPDADRMRKAMRDVDLAETLLKGMK